LPTLKNASPEQKILTFIQENSLAARREKLVVAVSGGADSVCLLYALAGLRQKLGISLHVAHLNHQLRDKESDADARYVAGLAKKLGIPATVAARDVKAYQQEHRLSLEEAAREVRYSFFAEVAKAAGTDKVAVGHTADDHVETLLLHIIRGSGTKGLRGLAPLNTLNVSGRKLTVIRPLLALSRAETVAYCRDRKLKPRLDATNLSTEPLRNKVRLRLLPELRQYNPQINEALSRLSHTAADDLDFIEKEAQRLQNDVLQKEKGSVVINKKDFLALHPALQRQLLRSAVASLLGSLKDIESSHIEDVIEALPKPAGKVITLPFGLNFTIEYDRYILAKASTSLCPYPTLKSKVALKIPGKTTFSGWTVNATIEKGAKRGGEANDFTACFDLDHAGNNLIVRSRLAGDRFQPLGLKQPKKLNVFMIDARIPQSWRRNIPLVVNGEEIIWVVGYRIDERYKVRSDTKNILRLEFKF
jgi:tRNA(Ile)-lysidine synthase